MGTYVVRRSLDAQRETVPRNHGRINSSKKTNIKEKESNQRIKRKGEYFYQNPNETFK
ncbi:hypothetical protein SESBI_11741 [Sesbania bispinosa]|nr:hypothetical protein SESBI_11741 [Sesbania bispinosa]